jgi:hypothetical protein
VTAAEEAKQKEDDRRRAEVERAEERRQKEKSVQEGALRVREELGGAGRRGDGERRGRCERCGGEAGSSREPPSTRGL